MIDFKPVKTAAIALIIAALSVPSVAAQQRPVPERQSEPAPQPAPQIVMGQDADARETREKLEELIRKLPPAVGRVLRTDPSLLTNETYLATYPALGVFLKQHPEVRTAPSFFFEHIGPSEFYRQSPPEPVSYRMWRDMFEFTAVGGIFLTVTGALIWIIRMLVEYRRWQRASKVHTEVHNKLLDRFTSNEDLMAYMQTPAGRRFLESAPVPIDAPARPVGAPFSRILWSVQVGIVLAAGALGMLFVSGRVEEEVAQPFFALGVLGLTLGAGFVVSAGASIVLSKRMGLLESAQPTSTANDTH
jgi:hypothetical protein